MRPLHGEKDRKRTTWDLKPLDSCKRKVSNSGIHNYNPSAGNDRHCWLRAGEGAAEVDVFVEFSPCTRAEHGVGYGIGVNLVVWAGVVLVLLGGFFLPRLEHPCHPRFTANRRSGIDLPWLCRAIDLRVALNNSIGSPTETRQALGPSHLCARFTRVSTAIDT